MGGDSGFLPTLAGKGFFRILVFIGSHTDADITPKAMELEDGVWLFNPGRLGRRSSTPIRAAYGVVRIMGSALRLKIAQAAED